MIKFIARIFAIYLLFPFSLFAASTLTVGKDYKIVTIKPPLGFKVSSNSVIEFFNPGCPACFRVEPAVEAWVKTKGKGVQFSGVPIVFHEEWKIYSRAYYVAVDLGVDKKVIPALFNEIHVKNNFLKTQPDMVAFFSRITKLNPKIVDAAFNSLTVDVQVQQAKQTMNAYQIYEIPTFLVGGKYLVTAGIEKDPKSLMKKVDYLLTLSATEK